MALLSLLLDTRWSLPTKDKNNYAKIVISEVITVLSGERKDITVLSVMNPMILSPAVNTVKKHTEKNSERYI